MDLEERRREHLAAARLRRRLWGAAVLIALGVIALPLLLDGSGSESRFRRVERLREEPPRSVPAANAETERPAASEREGVASDGVLRGGGATDARASDALPPRAPAAIGADGATAAPDRSPPPSADAARSRPDVANGREGAADADRIERGGDDTSVWLVQAGSFGESARAVGVRDRLREAGYPAFVEETRADGAAAGAARTLFRVQVGPLVGRGHAETLRDEVATLLGAEAIVVGYR